MRILIDACLPQKLRHEFADHDVFTAAYMGWSDLSNGDLLDAMNENGFDTLLTVDANLPHQQSVSRSNIAVFILRAPTNRLPELLPLVAKLQPLLPHAVRGTTVVISY